MIKLQDLIKEARISSADIDLFKAVRKIITKIMKMNGGTAGKRHTTSVRGYHQFSTGVSGKWSYAWEPFKRGAPGYGYINVMGDEKTIKKVARKINSQARKVGIKINFKHGVTEVNQNPYWKIKSAHGYDSRQFDKVRKIFKRYKVPF